jgi:hypothetical protein
MAGVAELGDAEKFELGAALGTRPGDELGLFLHAIRRALLFGHLGCLLGWTAGGSIRPEDEIWRAATDDSRPVGLQADLANDCSSSNNIDDFRPLGKSDAPCTSFRPAFGRP